MTKPAKQIIRNLSKKQNHGTPSTENIHLEADPEAIQRLWDLTEEKNEKKLRTS